jgi:hypothetical protein
MEEGPTYSFWRMLYITKQTMLELYLAVECMAVDRTYLLRRRQGAW